MKIRLNEVPENGQNYDFNRKTAELNEALSDLIKSNDYNVDIFISPLNSKDFSLSGTVLTKIPQQCGRCAEDFNFEIKKKINEILIPTQEQDRTSKYAKSSAIQVSEETISVTEYTKQQFDLGEFIHEAVALEIPFVCYCETCSTVTDDQAFIYDEKMGEDVKPNPFQALKGIKLN